MLPAMRAAVLHGVGDIALEEGPDPAPAAREVLVRVAPPACAALTSTTTRTDGSASSSCAPMVLGHEASGEVGALGVGCDVLHAGDRVAMEPRLPCGRCVQCRMGRSTRLAHTEGASSPRRDPESIKPVVRREE
jgi:L-iditol 2-dehydrogenase